MIVAFFALISVHKIPLYKLASVWFTFGAKFNEQKSTFALAANDNERKYGVL